MQFLGRRLCVLYFLLVVGIGRIARAAGGEFGQVDFGPLRGLAEKASGANCVFIADESAGKIAVRFFGPEQKLLLSLTGFPFVDEFGDIFKAGAVVGIIAVIIVIAIIIWIVSLFRGKGN